MRRKAGRNLNGVCFSPIAQFIVNSIPKKVGHFFSFLGLSNILKNSSSFGTVFFVDRAKDDPGSTQLLVNDSKSVCDNR